MQRWLVGSIALLTMAFLFVSSARAAIDWDYIKPPAERSIGQWFNEILGLSDFGRSYAVIVGLSQYENFNPLDATQNDPQRIFEFLRDEAGFDYLLMLRNEEVTYQALRNLFEFELPGTLKSNDRFLLFWSGHGTQFVDARGVELGYLPLTSSPAMNKATMVSMTDLARWDNDLPAKQALFLLDACFSGLAGRVAQSGDRDLEIRELSKPGHHIISAGGRDQQTIASRQEWQGSIFTYGLLKALRGDADRYGGRNGGDGVINLHELVAHMGETVKNAKAEAGWNRPLRPTLHVFRGEGQFFFLTHEKKKTHLEAQGLSVGDTWSFGMPAVMGSPASVPGQIEVSPMSTTRQSDERVWNGIKDSNDPAEFEIFIDTYPESLFLPFAKRRLERLQASQHAALTEESAQSRSEAPQPAIPNPAQTEAALDLRREDRRTAQKALTALGFDTRGIDGIFGQNTRRAIARWQRDEDAEPTGYLTSAQFDELLADAEPIVAALEAARKEPKQIDLPISAPPQPSTGHLLSDAIQDIDFNDGSRVVYKAEFSEWRTYIHETGKFRTGAATNKYGFRGPDDGGLLIQPNSATWIGSGDALNYPLEDNFIMAMSFVVAEGSSSMSFEISDDFTQGDYYNLDFYINFDMNYIIRQNRIEDGFNVYIHRNITNPDGKELPAQLSNRNWSQENVLLIKRQESEIKFYINRILLETFSTDIIPIKKISIGIAGKSSVRIRALEGRVPL